MKSHSSLRIHKGQRTIFIGHKPSFFRQHWPFRGALEKKGTAHLIVDLGFGDGGKGALAFRMADTLRSDRPNAAIIGFRYNGGPQAGHGIEYAPDCKVVVNQVPMATLAHPNNKGFLGAGMLVDLSRLQAEFDSLKINHGFDVKNRVFVSNAAFLVLPFHIDINRMQAAYQGQAGHSTIGRGIFPAYLDQQEGRGLQVRDLFLSEEELKQKIEILLQFNCTKAQGILSCSAGLVSRHYNPEHFELQYLYNLCRAWRSVFSEKIVDESQGLSYIKEQYEAGASIVAEGSQGVLLDRVNGTYPYNSPTHAMASALNVSTSLPMDKFEAIGVFRPYMHRWDLGNAPLPTEIIKPGKEHNPLRDDVRGDNSPLQQIFRIGWLDLELLKYSLRLNPEIQGLFISCLDRLDSLSQVKIAQRYEGRSLQGINQTERDTTLTDILRQATPIYREFPGWQREIGQINSFDGLPREAKELIWFIQKQLEVDVYGIGVGAGIDQIIIRD